MPKNHPGKLIVKRNPYSLEPKEGELSHTSHSPTWKLAVVCIPEVIFSIHLRPELDSKTPN